MKITIDLNKARYCSFGYVNQEGDKRASSSSAMYHTVHGIRIEADEFAYPFDHRFPCETLLERAKRLDILDVWTPVCVVTFTKYDTVTYKGDKALSIRDAWNKMIFSRINKKQKKGTK